MPAFDSDREKFAALNAQVLDISTDSIYSHLAWQKHAIGTMHFPMCSDFYPHAAATQAFGIFREGPPLPGISERAVFIVNKSGRIVFADTMDAVNNYVAPHSVLVWLEEPPSEEALLRIRGIVKVDFLTERQIRLFFNGDREPYKLGEPPV